MTFTIIVYQPVGQVPDHNRRDFNIQTVAGLVTEGQTRFREIVLLSPRDGLTLEAAAQDLVPSSQSLPPITGIIVMDCLDREEALGVARRLEYATGTIVEIRPALRLLEP